MNYEELYAELTALEKELKEKITAAQKLMKSITAETESGNLKDCAKDIAALAEVTSAQQDVTERLSAAVSSFDSRTYFENGDFAAQLLSCCQEADVDVIGEFPVFEMFPYRVRIDAENQDLYLDRKKVACMRPTSFAKTVKAGKEKLMKASFNAQAFASELANAYDLALLKEGKKPGADLYLLNLYKYLAPMSRFRKDYDQQSFAFDLARLYSEELEEIKDGRRFQFGSSRNNAKSIRVLDKNGHEQFFATIRFFEG